MVNLVLKIPNLRSLSHKAVVSIRLEFGSRISAGTQSFESLEYMWIMKQVWGA